MSGRDLRLGRDLGSDTDLKPCKDQESGRVLKSGNELYVVRDLGTRKYLKLVELLSQIDTKIRRWKRIA